jgi:hypothetical protein
VNLRQANNRNTEQNSINDHTSHPQSTNNLAVIGILFLIGVAHRENPSKSIVTSFLITSTYNKENLTERFKQASMTGN